MLQKYDQAITLTPRRRVLIVTFACIVWVAAYIYGKYSFLKFASPNQLKDWDLAHAIHFFATLVIVINSFMSDNLAPAVNWAAFGVIFFLSVPTYLQTVTGDSYYSYVTIIGILCSFIIVGFFVIRWMRGDWD